MPDDRELEKRAASADPMTPDAPERAAAILVVDDNEMNRELLSERLSERGHLVFQAADGAFEFIGTRLARVSARLDAIRPRVQGLSGWAKRLQAAERDAELQRAIESVREHLDAAAAELKASEGALDPIEAVARGVESAATAFAPSSVRASEVAAFAGEVATAASRLDALRAKLLEVRERRLLAREFAVMCLAEATDLDTRLTNVSNRIGELGGRVSTTRASYANTGRRVHTWIAFGALGLAGALLWFAASQVCMLRLLRGLLH